MTDCGQGPWAGDRAGRKSADQTCLRLPSAGFDCFVHHESQIDPNSRGQGAQPQEHRRGDPPRSARGRHRAVRVGQVHAGVRHRLRRGAAEVHGVAVGVRPAVPRSAAEAGGREIEGLPPTIAIEQRSASSNPRSTVATTTEIYDYLRVLFARAGTPHCWECGREIASQTPTPDRRCGDEVPGRARR